MHGLPRRANYRAVTVAPACRCWTCSDNTRLFAAKSRRRSSGFATSGRFVLGPDCEQLEQSLASYCQVPHAVACASGSDALLLALMAYDIGPGDEVLMPSYTFFATASAAWRLGAKPVFVDIDPITFNLDPRLLEALITPATKAIIPVHLYGQCADMRPSRRSPGGIRLRSSRTRPRRSEPNTTAAAPAAGETSAA